MEKESEKKQNEDLFEIVKERFKNLDDVSQDYLLSEDLLDKINKIVQSENIPLGQALEFENAVFGVLVGATRSTQFLNTLLEMGLSKEKINKIIPRVENEIIQPIKKQMRVKQLKETADTKEPKNKPKVTDKYREPIGEE